jgi:hypothetical protein
MLFSPYPSRHLRLKDPRAALETLRFGLVPLRTCISQRSTKLELVSLQTFALPTYKGLGDGGGRAFTSDSEVFTSEAARGKGGCQQ